MNPLAFSGQNSCTNFTLSNFQSLIAQANDKLVMNKLNRYNINEGLTNTLPVSAGLNEPSALTAKSPKSTPAITKTKKLKRLSLIEETRDKCMIDNMICKSNLINFLEVRDVFKDKLLSRLKN
jgi:hypothetical protein